jgi:hypothetical protein
MIAFIIRIVLALVATGFNVYLFTSGHWGWGITFIFLTALIIVSFFRNENVLLALNQMRVGNTDKAKKYIDRITHPEYLPKKQHAYVLFLKAVLKPHAQLLARLRELVMLRRMYHRAVLCDYGKYFKFRRSRATRLFTDIG